jgi:hypothetical protein
MLSLKAGAAGVDTNRKSAGERQQMAILTQPQASKKPSQLTWLFACRGLFKG